MKVKPNTFITIRWKRNKSFHVYLVDNENVWFFDSIENEWHKSMLLKVGDSMPKGYKVDAWGI